MMGEPAPKRAELLERYPDAVSWSRYDGTRLLGFIVKRDSPHGSWAFDATERFLSEHPNFQGAVAAVDAAAGRARTTRRKRT